MAKKQAKRPSMPNSGNEEIPPGATKEADDRSFPDRRRGKAGSGAGTRHAAADPGSTDEEYGAVDSNAPAADGTLDDEEVAEVQEDEAFSGARGGAVGGTPAGGRATGGRTGKGIRPGGDRNVDSTVGTDPETPAE